MPKTRYSEEQIREILATAYPGKSAAEIDAMVQETLDQYLAESEPKSPRKNRGRKAKNQ